MSSSAIATKSWKGVQFDTDDQKQIYISTNLKQYESGLA